MTILYFLDVWVIIDGLKADDWVIRLWHSCRWAMFSIIGFCCCILFRRCVFSIGGFRLLIGVFILLLGNLSLGSYLVYNLTLSANYYC